MYKAKIDLHCHSKASSDTGIWILEQLGCPESYTSPESIYKIATNRGMDFVTITDHDVIDGVKEIAYYNNVIVGKEITTFFPDRVMAHVICLDITESQHEEINRVRQNIYELVDYLSIEDIIHFVAHPFFKVNGDLTWEHFEKLVLLFKRHEIINGGRSNRTNRTTEQFLSQLTNTDIERYANKHNIEPVGKEAWKKFYVGGSDDHGGLFIGSCYTEVDVEGLTKEALLKGIRNGHTRAYGETQGSLTLAHQIGSIANHYLVSKLGEDSQEAIIVNRILNRHRSKEENKKKDKKKKSGSKWLKKISKSLDRDKSPFNLIDEVRIITKEKPDLSRLFQKKPLSDKEFNELFFNLASELLDRLIVRVPENLDLINPLMKWGFIILSTYLLSMSSVYKDIDLLEQAESLIGIKKPKKVAWFTDRYHGTDGVVVTINKFIGASIEYNCDMTVVISDNIINSHTKGVKSFPSITQFKLPMYKHIDLHVPSLLKVARWMEEEEFDSIVISTPGPMGFAGMISAKVIGLPITGIYHTDYPRYARDLTGDQWFANIVTKLTKAFYDQADRILVPSFAYLEELKGWGIREEKIGLLKRWVDRQLFSPEKRNGYFKDNGYTKLLYVGRISKEKNIDLLLKAYFELLARGMDFTIYCVGDGPYLRELKEKTSGLEKFEFLGELFGEELAEAYASADLFVFPSLTDSFGNVVLEAQASGLPCVVMNQGGPKEIVADGVSGLVAKDEKGFIDAIDQLISNNELRNQMSQAAVINSRQFNKQEIFSTFWQNL